MTPSEPPGVNILKDPQEARSPEKQVGARRPASLPPFLQGASSLPGQAPVGVCGGVPGAARGRVGAVGQAPGVLGASWAHTAQPCEAWESLWRNHESQLGVK